jgi:hypothetical protein
LLSELEFASLLVYPSRPETDEQRLFRNLGLALKRDQMVGRTPRPASEAIAQTILDYLHLAPFRDWFGPEVLLVPCVSHSLTRPEFLSPPRNLCQQLHLRSLGAAVSPCVRRITPVEKSATGGARRPSIHYDSVEVVTTLLHVDEVLLVDDVVGSGATLLGVGSRLAETFPAARIRAFAAFRVVQASRWPGGADWWCTGRIDRKGDRCSREP